MSDLVELTGDDLTVENVVNVSRNGHKVILADSAVKRINKSHASLMNIADGGKTVYGVNTGFGSFKDKVLARTTLQKLSRNIILSHACGTDEYLPKDVVRAALLIRANSFATGKSGVSIELVQILIDLLNKNITPLVPKLGSLAACGDLCLLSHVGLIITVPNTTEDHSTFDNWKVMTENGDVKPAYVALAENGIKQIYLGPKEGLALTNGSTFTAGLTALNLYDSETIMNASIVSLTLSLEALMGVPNAFDERIHDARKIPGSIRVAELVRCLTSGSTFVKESNRLQDPYTIRCAPQVLGPVMDVFQNIRTVLTRELNASTDNPLVFENDVVSGGNFHGEVLGIASDTLKNTLCSLGGISERRLARLVDASLSNGLPSMLVTENPGLNSGMMITQYTAASLVLSCQTLASPDTIKSLPTSENQEDYNSNAWNSSLFCRDIVSRTLGAITWEIYNATRAIQIRFLDEKTKDLKLGNGTDKLYRLFNEMSLFVPNDHDMKPAYDRILAFLKSDEFAVLFSDLTQRKEKKLNLEPPSGMRDFHPYQMKAREQIMGIIKQIFTNHGGQQIDTPVMERRDTLLGQYGDGNKLVYDLDDQGTPLSLRYDLTVPFARYLALHNVRKMKRFHIGKVYRRDHPSIVTGRMREFYQCDFDFCGKGSTMVQDAEILQVVCDVLTRVNVTKFVVKVNHRQILTGVMELCGVDQALHNTVLSSIDKLDKQSWESVREEIILKGTTPDVADYVGKFLTVKGPLVDAITRFRSLFTENTIMSAKIENALNEMDVLFGFLEAYQIDKYCEFDLSLARGLGYYTGMIFEAVVVQETTSDQPPVRIGSIAAGGRYDKLVGMFAGRDVPSVGCSFGIERLFALAEQKMEQCTNIDIDVWVYPMGDNAVRKVMGFMNEFWRNNVKAQMQDDLSLKMKDQIEFCLTNNVKYMIIVGDDEVKNDTITIKNIAEKSQITMNTAYGIANVVKNCIKADN